VRCKYIYNGKINDSEKIGEEGNVFLIDKSHRRAHTGIFPTTLFHHSYSGTNGNNIYKRYRENKDYHI